MALTFDDAIEILEITNISKLTIEELPRIRKRAQKRWHPDSISHLDDPKETQRFTEKFQQVAEASEIILAFLKGEYSVGEKFTSDQPRETEEPAEIIRQQATSMQSTIRDHLGSIKKQGYKLTTEEVLLSDGFKLRDILNQDFKEDIAALSIISLVYGFLLFMVVAIILGIVFPPLGVLAAIAFLLHAIACLFGFLPLSRFWIPDAIQDRMIWFINQGLKTYHWATNNSQRSNAFIQLLVQVPVLISKGVKYLVLFPLYELAKLLIGDKVVGVVKRQATYYAGVADWYIDELTSADPLTMSDQQLYDLSHFYGATKEFIT